MPVPSVLLACHLHVHMHQESLCFGLQLGIFTAAAQLLQSVCRSCCRTFLLGLLLGLLLVTTQRAPAGWACFIGSGRAAHLSAWPF
jgi:hypothetical protein